MDPQKTHGEMAVQASVNGRRMTLDPVRSAHLSIAAREVESTLPCGFRQGWVEGDVAATGKHFSLEAGAGVGSRWLTFTYDGRDFCMDVGDIVTALIGFADAADPAPPKPKRKRAHA